MHAFYFLTPIEHFKLLKEVAVNWSVQVGISFRRFSPSGFVPGYETCNWNEDLATKYLDGGHSEIYLSTNNSLPEHQQDWEFPDRELHNLIIIQGGRVCGSELEQAYLRVFAKQSHSVPLYRKLRRTLKNTMGQGLYAGRHYYKDTFYSAAAASMRMVDQFGRNEFARKLTNG
jgi:hypothetical protein